MTICETCTYADAHGWWGPEHKGTHCRDCHRSWRSTREAHCTTCHEHFTADSAAERHWVKGHHVDPEQVDGLYLGPDGAWSTSADRDPTALRERLARGRRKVAA